MASFLGLSVQPGRSVFLGDSKAQLPASHVIRGSSGPSKLGIENRNPIRGLASQSIPSTVVRGQVEGGIKPSVDGKGLFVDVSA